VRVIRAELLAIEGDLQIMMNCRPGHAGA